MTGRFTESSGSPEAINEQSSTTQNAGFGVRLLAYLIDMLIVMPIVLFVLYSLFGFDQLSMSSAARLGESALHESMKQRSIARYIGLIAYIVYCGLLECSGMQATIGKRAMGIRVADDRGNPLSAGRSFARNFAKIASYLPLTLGFLWVIWSKQKKSWHDMIAKTVVIKVK